MEGRRRSRAICAPSADSGSNPPRTLPPFALPQTKEQSPNSRLSGREVPGEGDSVSAPLFCAVQLVGAGWTEGRSTKGRRMDALLIPRTAAITLGRLRCCARGNKGGWGAPPLPLRFASVCVCSIPTTLVRTCTCVL